MFSKAELEYLKNPRSVSDAYGYVLKNRIRVKAQALQEELALLNGMGILQNSVRSPTENCKVNAGQITANQPAFLKSNMEIGAFGGIWTRDHYLTKVTPHRARLRRQISGLPHKQIRY